MFSKLDNCHLKFDSDWKYVIETVDARQLLSSYRFDLYAILQYIDQKVKGVSDLSFAQNVYYQRTNIITGYTCSERGNDHKNNFQDFINTLDGLISDFLTGNYDSKRTLIPVDKNNVIVDGAHRVCCAAYFNKTVDIIRFVDHDFQQHVTADFLIRNGLPTSVADSMALEYCNWHSNLYILFLWPKSFCNLTQHKEANKLIEEEVRIIYRKRTKMKYNAIRNLMIQIYGHMPWVGNVENNFQNTFVKANEVWDNNGNVEFILCESSSCEKILALKQKVRDIFQLKLASIHSTDNDVETRIAANLIFNTHSMHHLEFGHPDKYVEAHHLVESFKKQLKTHHLDVTDYIIDSSMVMSIYGIRNASDLDYYTLNSESRSIIWQGPIENHKKFIIYYNKSISDLIYNPDNYFIYNGLKFVTLHNLLTFKKNRGEDKDLNDIELIKSYIKSNKLKLYWLTKKDQYRRNKIKYINFQRKWIYFILAKIGLDKCVAKIYHSITHKK